MYVPSTSRNVPSTNSKNLADKLSMCDLVDLATDLGLGADMSLNDDMQVKNGVVKAFSFLK